MTQLQVNQDMGFLKQSVIHSNLDMVIKLALILVLDEFKQ